MHYCRPPLSYFFLVRTRTPSFGVLGIPAFLLACAGRFVHRKFAVGSGSVRGPIMGRLVVVFLMDERVEVGCDQVGRARIPDVAWGRRKRKARIASAAASSMRMEAINDSLCLQF